MASCRYPGFSCTADAPEQAIPFLGGSQPRVNRGLDPFEDRRRPNVPAFAEQIYHGPVVLASPKVRHIKLCSLLAKRLTYALPFR
jgi:hypothetical protein